MRRPVFVGCRNLLSGKMASHGNIFLVGPMGAGKTTVAKRLAHLKGMDFVDSDQELERRTGVDIPYIFEMEGEEGFRKREREVIDELTGHDNVVLATGGGAVLDADNREHLSSRGLVIYLYATVDQQIERTRFSKQRPLLNTDNPRERLESLMAVRDPLYREVADIVFETDSRHARHLAKRIAQRLDELTLL